MEDKICPMKFNTKDESRMCLKSDCMWWVNVNIKGGRWEYKNGCAISILAEKLD